MWVDRRRRALAVLAALAFLLGFAATPSLATAGAPAQTEPDLTKLFGGYISSARGNGFQLTYDSPGLLPVGSPIFQLSIPEALATLSTGPTGYALASFTYPGPLVADLGSALEQGGTSAPIPPYPVRAQANYPSGTEEASTGDGGTEQTVSTKFADSRAYASYSTLDFAPAIRVGSSRARSQTVVEGDQVVTRTRAEVSDIGVLGGVMRIESVVTDLVATSNGTTSASDGQTRVSGVTVLGRPAVIDGDGIRFVDDPTDDGGGEDDPTGGGLDPLGGAIDPVAGGLDPATVALNALLAELGASGDEALAVLFEQAGIRVELLDPIATSDSGTAERTANGLKIDVIYEGRNTPVLIDVLDLIPPNDPLSDGIGQGGSPFTPQTVLQLLKETHITGMAIAPANVYVAATPAFEFPVFDFPTTLTPSGPSPTAPAFTPGGTGSGGSGGGSDGGFASGTPDLPPAAAPVAAPTVPTASRPGVILGGAIPALAVIAAILGSPFFAIGSRRLADNALAGVTTSCPEGLDAPTPPGGADV